jgi:hypothetical protein
MWFGKQSKEIRKGIGEECDAFLRGEYVEYASAMGWDTPVWAWMNAIAHADENRLAQIAVFGFRHDIALAGRREWNRAASCIASAVLDEVSRSGRRLTDLQNSLFIPLELLLIEDQSTWGLSSNQLVAVAVAVLRRHPSSLG